MMFWALTALGSYSCLKFAELYLYVKVFHHLWDLFRSYVLILCCTALLFSFWDAEGKLLDLCCCLTVPEALFLFSPIFFSLCSSDWISTELARALLTLSSIILFCNWPVPVNFLFQLYFAYIYICYIDNILYTSCNYVCFWSQVAGGQREKGNRDSLPVLLGPQFLWS